MWKRYERYEMAVKDAVISGIASFVWMIATLIPVLVKGTELLAHTSIFTRLVLCLFIFLPQFFTLYMCWIAHKEYIAETAKFH